MTIVDGRFETDTVDEILDLMISNATQYFDVGEDLNDSELAVIRTFYRPIAEQLAAAQTDISAVLDSAQLDHADGKALDLLVEQVGITREDPVKATGVVTFSRATAATVDYPIPKGTLVQTEGIDPVVFQTTEQVTLASGTSSIDANVQAVEGGRAGNLGANTLVLMPDPPSGIEDVTNANPTGDPAYTDTNGDPLIPGSDRENDTDLRNRAKEEVGSGSRASLPALENNLKTVDGVTSVSVIENDTDSTDGDGRPSHSIEPIVAGGQANDIAQTILETKAAGIPCGGGYLGSADSGTATLPNGDTKTINFSRPTEVLIYVDLEVSIDDTFAGEDEIQDSIVRYLGGVLSSGKDFPGGLQVGEDVLYGEIEYAVRDVTGVYDVLKLWIGTSANPTGETNLSINAGSEATGNATNGSITILTQTV